jgi:oligopeptidase A
VGLEGEIKEKFNKLQLEQADLKTKFSNNLLDATKAFKLKLTEVAQVEGLPISAKKLASQQAVREGDTQSTPESGPWVITLDMPSYLPAMQHLKSREIREKLYRAYVTRASESTTDNAPLIKRILQIKQEMAQILGYPSYAELSLSKKMAPNVDSVLALIDMLLSQSKPAAEMELQEVTAFARGQGGLGTGGNEGEMKLWDLPYWSERLREKSYQFEEESLRPYFALPNVLTGQSVSVSVSQSVSQSVYETVCQTVYQFISQCIRHIYLCNTVQ